MKRKTTTRLSIAAVGVPITAVLLLVGDPGPDVYYASPAGGGDGTRAGSPFQVADFWPKAAAGKTLLLLDGHYRGARSMIVPPAGLSGTSGRPIMIRALNDGKVFLDGQGTNRVVALVNRNSWFVIEGLDAAYSARRPAGSTRPSSRFAGSVVGISNSSNHNQIKRVCAWDAEDSNTAIFGVHYSAYGNLLEDCAGFGTARKTYSNSQGGNKTTRRRCWGKWQRSTVTGPKMVYTLLYDNREALDENCIANFSGDEMPGAYTLKSYDGTAWKGSPKQWPTGTGTLIQNAYGGFSMDGLSPPPSANAKLLGSIGYRLATDVQEGRGVLMSNGSMQLDDVTLKDIAVIGPVNGFSQPIRLDAVSGVNITANDISAFGGAGGGGPVYGSRWTGSNRIWGPNGPAAYYPPGQSLYVNDGKHGATICKRYVNGVLTEEPLWPWPMDDRIYSALERSWRKPIRVTEEIEKLFGPIPLACRQPSLTPTPNHRRKSSHQR